jgi:hypothetical protein
MSLDVLGLILTLVFGVISILLVYRGGQEWFRRQVEKIVYKSSIPLKWFRKLLNGNCSGIEIC